MVIYELLRDYYPKDYVSVFLQHEKKFTSKEFEEMVMNVYYPEEGDEDYIDEYTSRDIYRIAEKLCEKFEFQYLVAEISCSI